MPSANEFIQLKRSIIAFNGKIGNERLINTKAITFADADRFSFKANGIQVVLL